MLDNAGTNADAVDKEMDKVAMTILVLVVLFMCI